MPLIDDIRTLAMPEITIRRPTHLHDGVEAPRYRRDVARVIRTLERGRRALALPPLVTPTLNFSWST